MGTPTKEIQQHDAVEFVRKILNQYDKDATVVMGNFQIDNIDFPLLQILLLIFIFPCFKDVATLEGLLHGIFFCNTDQSGTYQLMK